MAEITFVKKNSRIQAMDVMRGIAVLGILLMNIPAFSVHEFFLYWHDPLRGELTLNGFIYKASLVLFDGKMRGLFTILFGAGIILFIENKKDDSIQVADAYFRRTMWLLLFGIIDGYILLWGGDILYEYALCGMLLFAFRNLRVRHMFLISFLCLAFFTFLHGRKYQTNKEKFVAYTEATSILKSGKKLTEEQIIAKSEFEIILGYGLPFSKATIEQITEDIKQRTITHRSGYLDIFAVHSEEVYEYQSAGFYSDFWETFGTILLGMGLFKLGFFHYRLKHKLYLFLSFLVLPLGLAMCALSHYFQAVTQAELMQCFWKPFSTVYIEYPGRIFATVGYAAAILLICNVNWLNSFLSLFANVGRMALTNYVMQTILCSLYFYGFGLNHYGEYDAKGLLIFVIVIWIIQIIYSNIYLRFFQMGPLEWLWKRLTYGKSFVNVNS